MSKYAPVVSLGVAKVLEAAELYGDYHLLLAHQVLEDAEGWSKFMSSLRAKRKMTVIMDNSLIELGSPLEADKLLQAVQIVRAEYLVLPDCLGNYLSTINRATDAITNMHHHNLELPGYCSYLGVIQGETFQQHLECAKRLLRFDHLRALSIPRNAAQLFRSRYALTQEVWNMCKVPMHLLGFSDHLDDDLACAKLGEAYGVMGIDSAAPVREGMFGRILNYDTYSKGCPKRPKNYLEMDPSTATSPETRANIEWIRRELNNA